MKNKNIEVRIGYYAGPVVTSEMIKMTRDQIAMEQHYREQQENHETELLCLKLRSQRARSFSFIFLLPILIFLFMSYVLFYGR